MAAATGRPPLIGVTTSEIRRAERTDPLPEGEPPQHELALGMPYVRALERAGAVPVVLPPVDAGLIPALVAPLAGVCLSGGPDLDPSAYGAERDPHLGPTEPGLDAFELEVARCADAAGLPILGICRGAQALNVARGGSLHQHLPDHRQTDPGWVTTHDGRDRAALAAGRRSAARRSSRSTPSTTRRSIASAAGCARSPGRPAGRSRRSRATATGSCSASSGTRSRSTATPPCSARSWRRAGRRRPGGRLSRVRLRRRAAPAAARRTATRSRGCTRRSRRADPTATGSWTGDGVALVHRRLAIIDLSAAGAQPMHDDELHIVFNGCIYNHRELRAELERAGQVFASHADTEVLLKGWRVWGEGMLDRLAGMFAFCLHDDRSGRTVLVRDRLGIKPLYLAELPGGGLRAASTLPALVAAGGVDTSVDPVALHHYLSWHSVVPGAADDPRRRAQAPAGDDPHRRARRRAGRSARTGTRRSSARTPTGRPRTGRTRCSRRCASRSGGGWSPTCRSGCCCPAGSTRA